MEINVADGHVNDGNTKQQNWHSFLESLVQIQWFCIMFPMNMIIEMEVSPLFQNKPYEKAQNNWLHGDPLASMISPC